LRALLRWRNRANASSPSTPLPASSDAALAAISPQAPVGTRPRLASGHSSLLPFLSKRHVHKSSSFRCFNLASRITENAQGVLYYKSRPTDANHRNGETGLRQPSPVLPKNSAETIWRIEPEEFLKDSPLYDDATSIPPDRRRRRDEPTPCSS
jgi:hypothetical protein